jgi:thioredoxin-like negative regulator of GroEL
MEGLSRGVPAILYFTTPTCMPCKTVQRPAIQKVRETLGQGIQIIEIDASQRADLAQEWGVMSVPTTFIIDKNGQPRQVNHGVTRAEKLLAQLKD